MVYEVLFFNGHLNLKGRTIEMAGVPMVFYSTTGADPTEITAGEFKLFIQKNVVDIGFWSMVEPTDY